MGVGARTRGDPVILAFDTSTALTSVAVVDAGDVVAERLELDARRHAEVLAPLLESILAETRVDRASISAIACGVGPGPYTGLRVGIATARALGLAWDRPVLGLCSLDALAAAAAGTATTAFAVASDARRREVYWAAYGQDGTRVLGPLVSRPGDIDNRFRSGPWFGQGAVDHRSDLGPVLVDTAEALSALRFPHASWIARCVEDLLHVDEPSSTPGLELSAHGGDGSATAEALAGLALLPPVPLYLRRPDAAEAAHRSASGGVT